MSDVVYVVLLVGFLAVVGAFGVRAATPQPAVPALREPDAEEDR